MVGNETVLSILAYVMGIVTCKHLLFYQTVFGHSGARGEAVRSRVEEVSDIADDNVTIPYRQRLASHVWVTLRSRTRVEVYRAKTSQVSTSFIFLLSDH